MLTVAGILVYRKRGKGAAKASPANQPSAGAVDSAISQLRGAALMDVPAPDLCGVWRAVNRAGIRRRVLKRWATRLLREGLPKSRRLTGGQLAVFRSGLR